MEEQWMLLTNQWASSPAPAHWFLVAFSSCLFSGLYFRMILSTVRVRIQLEPHAYWPCVLRAMTPSYDCYEWPWLCWKALVRCLGGVSSVFMCIVFFLGVSWDCGTLRTHSPIKYNSVLWHCGVQEARLVHWFFSLYLGQAFAKGSHIQGSREISVARTVRKPIFTIKRVTITVASFFVYGTGFCGVRTALGLLFLLTSDHTFRFLTR